MGFYLHESSFHRNRIGRAKMAICNVYYYFLPRVRWFRGLDVGSDGIIFWSLLTFSRVSVDFNILSSYIYWET